MTSQLPMSINLGPGAMYRGKLAHMGMLSTVNIVAANSTSASTRIISPSSCMQNRRYAW